MAGGSANPAQVVQCRNGAGSSWCHHDVVGAGAMKLLKSGACLGWRADDCKLVNPILAKSLGELRRTGAVPTQRGQFVSKVQWFDVGRPGGLTNDRQRWPACDRATSASSWTAARL
jgi:hypothetical protein